jgi:hypothetical protein
MKPLVVRSGLVKAGVEICTAHASGVAVETVNVDCATNIAVVGRPALRTKALFVVRERHHDTSFLERGLQLLHLHYESVVRLIPSLLQLVLDLR